ncbi:nucleotide-binding universal stress UspA family protein [Actinoplanes xinjiangensis]|uniref:Nucleotide-binding universal stress UspA family protein n=1 Tax=Actinoplanes xinjiangensis TaxID=512350 RepID=A0A316F597_9ACTN|nr:universal stress protein [Actinoplanes xinjiangensis]PWK39834.1 nucleotide-binding universal stress UspA family protein [Actinoplanes xinjiangensis]GIF42800.1 hypothetical protein Axi01nite_71110 [Actinoplanes xinjiangensis]
MQKEIIVGYDGSPHAQTALMWALDEAARTGASVELVYVDGSPVLVPAARLIRAPVPLPDSYLTEVVNSTLERAVAKAKKTQPLIDVTARTVRAHPATALIDLSRKAHLIVLAGTGHSAVTGLLGSVSARSAAFCSDRSASICCGTRRARSRWSTRGPETAARSGEWGRR